MPVVSVIVPAYKAEAILSKCVESVLAQTFPDWELLLVDDGSPDQSGKLCDHYAQQDDRVRAFHKPNGGVSSARAGRLVDADDWIAPDMCEKLVDAVRASNADSAGCAHRNVLTSGEEWTEPAAMPQGVYGREEFRRKLVDRLLGRRLGRPGEVLNGFVWRFLFSREMIISHDLRFAGAYLEDELFLMEYFCLADKLVMLEEPLYFYLQNTASVTRNYLPGYMDTFRKFLEQKQKLVDRYGLGEDDPEWMASTCWAGLLIAVGNEFAPGNPALPKEKRHRIEALSMEKDMAEAIRTLKPRGLGRRKQLIADLIRLRWFGVISLLYKLKNG